MLEFEVESLDLGVGDFRHFFCFGRYRRLSFDLIVEFL